MILKKCKSKGSPARLSHVHICAVDDAFMYGPERDLSFFIARDDPLISDRDTNQRQKSP